MNPLENIKQISSFNYETTKDEKINQQNFAVDVAATVTAVGCYHPFAPLGQDG